MKYLIHLTAPVRTSFDADNLRGEPRWERNVVDALLSQGRQVHTTRPIWLSDKPKPPGLHDGVVPEWLDDSIYITYGVPARTHIEMKAKHYIVHYLDGPTEETKNEFLQYNSGHNRNIVATCNFKSWRYLSRLQRILGPENVEWVGGPAVPFVDETADNFDKPYLTWLYRNFWPRAHSDPSGMAHLCWQLAAMLDLDPSLKLIITIGAFDPAILDPVKDGRAWALSQPFMAPLAQHQDRIDVLSELHWHEILDILKQTRLVVSPPEPLGGPPFEAAMYGIPTVLDANINPFHDGNGNPLFNGLVTCKSKDIRDFSSKMGQLFMNHGYYRSHGNLYRQYVKETSTYEAFVQQIDRISRERGWF